MRVGAAASTLCPNINRIGVNLLHISSSKMYGDQPDLMASMMYANNMAYSQRFAPQMMPMMHDLSGMHSIGAQPMMHHTPKKAVKDKNAPKRNWTAYQFYVEEVSTLPFCYFSVVLVDMIVGLQNRQGLRENQPEAGFGQLSKIAAGQWKELPVDAKRRYEIMAENDKMRCAGRACCMAAYFH